MKTNKELPLNFFEKARPTTPEYSQKEIETIKWPKEVINGKKQILVTLPKENER